MVNLKKFIFSLSILFPLLGFSKSGYVNEMAFSLGMVNNPVVENESTIETTDLTVVAPESSITEAIPVSNISLSMNYSFLIKKKSSLGAFVVVPLVVAEGTSFFMGGLRYRSFLYSLSSGFNYAQKGITFHIIPRLRYYVGGSFSGGYLIYNTESAKKSDVSFNLGLEGGLMYQWNQKYSIDINIAMVKRTGIITTGMGMNIFLGMGITI